jgi:hypothetical protein
VGESRIVAQNISFAPPIGHEADDEIDGKTSAANHGLALPEGMAAHDAGGRRAPEGSSANRRPRSEGRDPLALRRHSKVPKQIT